jgi:RNA polymerase sigma factor (sigma-70 family)
MTETRRLLREYVEEGSESAFRELVERYIDLVYSTALRLVDGDSHRAEDAAQSVFIRLTQKAKTLDKEVCLGGWLHRDTCHVAATLMRGERRRQIRERQAVEMNALHDEPDSNLANVLPILDEAINELGDEDREVIMHRFFEQQSFRTLGEIVGSSEDAARMRVNRAVEKLQGLLRERGVAAVSIGGLATILGAKAVSAAPVGLAASVVKELGSSAIGGGASSPAAVRPLAKSLKLALMPGAALVLILSMGIYAGRRAAEKAATNPLQNIVAAPATLAPAQVAPETAPASTTITAFGFMTFHTIDADSGMPLSGTKILVAYFDSTNSKSVDLETDSKGEVRIGFPQAPFTSASIQVTSAGHVPVVSKFSEGEQMPTNYFVRLTAGSIISGEVLDEEQVPVANAKIELSGPRGLDITKRENIFFGRDTWLHTDANGKWWSDMVPADYENISVTVTHPDFAINITNVPVNSPDATAAVLRLRKGETITGTVLDSGGQPIAGASIREVNNRSDNPFSTNSDENGGFVLTHWNPGGLELSVQANGFSPAILDTVVSNSPVALDCRLGLGHILRGRVVDGDGNPVTNAMVQSAGDSQGVRRFEWFAKTDVQGKFEWNSAPADTLNYFIGADGFYNGVERLQADKTEHEIKLIRAPGPADPNLRIRGTATDADTGQPLEEFKVLVGRVQERPFPHEGVPVPPEFAFATDGRDGQFDFRKNMRFEGPTYQIQIQKDGYAPAVSTNLPVQNGDQILMFGLHKDGGFNGEVILPNGDPVTDATVFLSHAQGGVYMDGPGKVRKEISTHLHTPVDSHGHFSFASILNAHSFVVISDEGYAEVPVESFSGKIVLEPWGRIEGKLLVSERPGAGQTIWLSQVIYRRVGNSKVFLTVSMQTTTGADGSFVFEKVPPGERLVSQRPGPADRPGRIYQTQEKAVVVASGVVTRVELGGSGRVVTGRANLAGKPVNWQDVAAELNLKLPGAPSELPKPEDFPSTEAFRSAALAYGKAQREFWASEKGHEADRNRRSYSAYCSVDGSFSIPDVPPGQYKLNIDVRDRASVDSIDIGGKQVGLLDKEINVPESEDGKEHEVLDLGMLEVPAVKANQGGSVQFMYAQ